LKKLYTIKLESLEFKSLSYYFIKAQYDKKLIIFIYVSLFNPLY
jgi:hypothetical protein